MVCKCGIYLSSYYFHCSWFGFCICRTACMKLEEYRTAKTALEKGASITPSESKFKKLIDECNFLITGMFFVFFSCFLVDYVYMPRVIVLFAMVQNILLCNSPKVLIYGTCKYPFSRRRERFGSTGAFDFAFKCDSTTSI